MLDELSALDILQCNLHGNSETRARTVLDSSNELYPNAYYFCKSLICSVAFTSC